MSPQPPQPIDLFFSYAHKDESLRDELSNHLSILKRNGVINEWHDRQIPPGKEWKEEIDERLNRAQVILLLISHDFIASDYCHEIEMKRAMERHDKGEAVVIPVILSPCLWQDALFGKLQALPKNAKPVTTWSNQNEAFLNVAEGIKKAVEKLRAGSTSSSGPTGKISRQGFGEAVYRLCNRDSQEDDFDEFIRRNESPVLLCAIPAEERECPDSLGRRFTETIIKPYAQDRWGPQEGVINSKLIAWPEAGEPKTRQQRLLTRLWREVDCNRRALSAEDFGLEISTKLERVIVLRHTVRLQSWNEGERDLLDWYLGFWDDVNRQQPRPQLMVLFNLLYPDKPNSLWKSWLPGQRRFNREAVGAQIRELFGDAGCPKRVLDELPRIKYDDVKDWFDYYEIFDEGERVSICRKLFAGGQDRPMDEIEKALKQYHQEFLKQRG